MMSSALKYLPQGNCHFYTQKLQKPWPSCFVTNDVGVCENQQILPKK